MMNDIEDLYQGLIIDHNNHPQNFGDLPHVTAHARGVNPFCGDQFTVFLDVGDGLVKAISFMGKGCAISKASASMMTEAVKGKSVDEAQKIFEAFHAMLVSSDSASSSPVNLGKLIALAGVKNFPMRVKCATLAWHALHAALDGNSSDVTTEK